MGKLKEVSLHLEYAQGGEHILKRELSAVGRGKSPWKLNKQHVQNLSP